MSMSVIMKCTSAIRQLAYNTTPDAFNEYLQMGEHTGRDCLDNFNMCIIELFNPGFLRKPTFTTFKIYMQDMSLFMVFLECLVASIICIGNG